jgi:hypothetical protein
VSNLECASSPDSTANHMLIKWGGNWRLLRGSAQKVRRREKSKAKICLLCHALSCDAPCDLYISVAIFSNNWEGSEERWKGIRKKSANISGSKITYSSSCGNEKLDNVKISSEKMNLFPFLYKVHTFHKNGVINCITSVDISYDVSPISALHITDHRCLSQACQLHSAY